MRNPEVEERKRIGHARGPIFLFEVEELHLVLVVVENSEEVRHNLLERGLSPGRIVNGKSGVVDDDLSDRVIRVDREKIYLSVERISLGG